MNICKKIYNALSDAGIETYFAGAHMGICTAPYCVVGQYGGSLLCGSRGGRVRYRVALLVPVDMPSCMGVLVGRVRAALAALESSGEITLTVPCGAVVTDDRFKALSGYVEYAVYYSE